MNKLFHDDIRLPPNSGWIWARTNAEAIKILQKCDIFEASLDHDLGCHNWNPQDIEQAELSHDWCNGENGVDLAKKMVEMSLVPQVITLHSSNLDGVEAMYKILEPHAELIIVSEML